MSPVHGLDVTLPDLTANQQLSLRSHAVPEAPGFSHAMRVWTFLRAEGEFYFRLGPVAQALLPVLAFSLPSARCRAAFQLGARGAGVAPHPTPPPKAKRLFIMNRLWI
jgi:hypothetical protein